MSSEFMESFAKKNPNVKLDCPENHATAIDRACCECGYGIWTDTIICPHCGAKNTCGQCFPDEFDEERSQPFW